MRKEYLTSAYRKMRAILLVKARTIVSSDEEARDVIQEAFCNLWTKCPEIERQSQAEAILSTTVRNLSIDKLRRRNAHPTDSIDDSTEPPDIDNSSGEETADIYLPSGNSCCKNSVGTRQNDTFQT
ncbi:MAG: hypothetical protein HDS68_00125 [Bacteroidales bacterium]|nr:hypothetical protein [Bacteroidales bacterium]